MIVRHESRLVLRPGPPGMSAYLRNGLDLTGCRSAHHWQFGAVSMVTQHTWAVGQTVRERSFAAASSAVATPTECLGRCRGDHCWIGSASW